MIRVSNPSFWQEIFLFSKNSREVLGPTNGHRSSFCGVKRRGRLTHLVPRVRMSGATPVLPLYTFMPLAWTALLLWIWLPVPVYQSTRLNIQQNACVLCDSFSEGLSPSLLIAVFTRHLYTVILLRPTQTPGARCWWRSWLRHCAISRKVAVSIPDVVIGIFHWHNPNGRTMALRLTHPLTEMTTRGGKGGRCVEPPLLPSCADCLEIWEPQPPGTLWACPRLWWDCFNFTATTPRPYSHIFYTLVAFIFWRCKCSAVISFPVCLFVFVQVSVVALPLPLPVPPPGQSSFPVHKFCLYNGPALSLVLLLFICTLPAHLRAQTIALLCRGNCSQRRRSGLTNDVFVPQTC